jgi:hypothetical protein
MNKIIDTAKVANEANHDANEKLKIYIDHLVKWANYTHETYNRAAQEHMKTHAETYGAISEGSMKPGGFKMFIPLNDNVKFIPDKKRIVCN